MLGREDEEWPGICVRWDGLVLGSWDWTPKEVRRGSALGANSSFRWVGVVSVAVLLADLAVRPVVTSSVFSRWAQRRLRALARAPAPDLSLSSAGQASGEQLLHGSGE